MNKLLILPAIAVLLYACSKDSPSIPDPENAPAVSAVPSHFDQKVVIEQFTQSWNGQCPKANLYLDSLVKFNPGRVYGVSFHINDMMSDTTLVSLYSGRNVIDSFFNPNGFYPAGMVNRHVSSSTDLAPDLWGGKVLTELGHSPSCGLALEASKLNGSTLTLTIHVGFSGSMFGDYRLHAYIVENVVYSSDSLYDQMNDFSMNGVTPDTSLSLYNLDDTIHLYHHPYVLRKVITPVNDGQVIPQSFMTVGNEYVINYPVNISGINTGNSYIIAFVDKYGPDYSGHWIENVQSVPIGQSKDWN